MLQENPKGKKNKIVLKSPTQERSRQTVTTILNACSKLLIAEGFYSVTTDKIAKEAGVSIGSLYQFFGNKESVVLAVIKRLHEDDKKLALDGVAKLTHLPARERVLSMIELGFTLLRSHSELRSKLLTVQYYLADINYMSETIRFFEDLALRNLPVAQNRDPRQVAKIYTNTFVGLMNVLAVENPNFDKDIEQRKEIEKLFLNYLEI